MNANLKRVSSSASSHLSETIGMLAVNILKCMLLLVGSAATCSARPGGAAATGTTSGRATSLGDWRVCDEGQFEISGGDVAPYPAHSGEEVTFRVNGTSSECQGCAGGPALAENKHGATPNPATL